MYTLLLLPQPFLLPMNCLQPALLLRLHLLGLLQGLLTFLILLGGHLQGDHGSGLARITWRLILQPF